MKTIVPDKLRAGDKVMVISPSDSLRLISGEVKSIADQRLAELGFEVVFGKNASELDEFDSSSIESRVADMHEAFADKSVKGILVSFGGYNSNQLLRYLDWELIKNNPKVLVGFSDTTALQNAIYAKTGLVTYSGPSYSTFGRKLYFDYTLASFKDCLMSEAEMEIRPSESWSDDWWLADQESRQLMPNEGWLVINEGEAKGKILGANICTFNLLQGTEYFPDITDAILWLEDDSESKLTHFDRDLQSLIHLPNFDKVRGIVIGRFQQGSEVKKEHLIKAIRAKRELNNLPVIANVDFGHTDPIITFPIGGEAELKVKEGEAEIKIVKH